MTTRNYTSLPTLTSLSAAITTTSATSCTVVSTTNFPSVPFTMGIDMGTTSEELVLVTAVVGTTLTITRGYDSTTAATHLISAPLQHAVGAIDYREANTHINDTGAGGAHGVTTGFVDTGSNQTIAGNKSFTGQTTLASALTGVRRVLSNVFSSTTGSGDAMTFLTLGSANLAMNITLEIGCIMSTTVITRTYDITMTSTIGTVSTWYVLLPVDSSTDQATSGWDFQVEINRTSSTSVSFRVHNQNSTANAAPGSTPAYVISVEIDSEITSFTSSTTTSNSAGATAITAIHPSNQLYSGPTHVGIGTQTPTAPLFVVGLAQATSMTAQAFLAGGLTGTSGQARLVGSNTSIGAPSSGAFNGNDIALDSAGMLWVCTTAGSPGTWTTFPRGRLTSSGRIVLATQTIASTTETMCTYTGVAALSATYISGRRYKVTWKGSFSDSVAGVVTVRIRDGGASAPTTASTLLDGSATPTAVTIGNATQLEGVFEWQPSAGVHELGMSFQSSVTGTLTVGNANFGIELIVEDIGV